MLDAPQAEIVCSHDPRWRAASLRDWGIESPATGSYLGELIAHHFIAGPARARLQPLDRSVLTVVVLDGPAGLGSRAPLGEVEGAPRADAWCRALLSGDPAARSGAELASIVEPEVWRELATLTPKYAELVAAESEGVGRYVARWEV